MTSDPPKKLLVLDLDETLVHATGQPLAHAADFLVGPYHVYKRPHVDAFLAAMLQAFDVGVWTSSGDRYAAAVVAQLFPQDVLRFVWASDRCTTARDFTTGEYVALKPLVKLKKHGFAMESMIAVDDTPGKHVRNYGNLVTVREFTGDRSDDELLLLARYLPMLIAQPDMRLVDKRQWRDEARAALEAAGDRPGTAMGMS